MVASAAMPPRSNNCRIAVFTRAGAGLFAESAMRKRLMCEDYLEDDGFCRPSGEKARLANQSGPTSRYIGFLKNAG